MTSLFEQIGGRGAVSVAVDIFYGHVLADVRIAHFFEDIDMEKQKNKQKAFLMMAFGGPSQYSGKNLRDGHAHLVEKGLDDSHFDAVAENLVKTLNELNVPEGLIAQVLAIVGPTRDDVLGRGVTV
jgi:hemoglobin